MEPVGLVVLLGTLAGATAVGAWRRRTDGRVRPGRPAAPQTASAPTAGLLDLVGEPGERATLVQLSSAFCAPCRAARVVLADVAGRTAGVRHVEIDAEAHLDLVRRLGVTRTPTTLVLDATGREVGRAAGVPRRDQIAAVLDALGATPSQ